MNDCRPRKLFQETARAIGCTRATAGFSLLELLIAMTATLLLLTAASTLLTSSLNARSRENRRAEALSDAQRAISLMSREIANSGFGLVDNGIVVADSGQTAIRIRANVDNKGEVKDSSLNPLATNDADEDITYILQADNRSIVRYDRIANASIVLARPVDVFRIRYLDAADVETALPNAVKVRLTVLITLPAINGQPASQVQLTSDIALRNAPSVLGRY